MKNAKKVLSIIMSIITIITINSTLMTVFADENTLNSSIFTNINDTVSGTLSKTNKFVYYEYNLPSSGKVTFDFTAYAESTVYVYLYDANGNKVDYFGIYPNKNLGYCYEQHVAYFEKGSFYLKIDSLGSDIRMGNYSISNEFTSANESFPEELNANNDLAGSANRIEVDKTYKGQLGYSDDHDFYRLDLAKSYSLLFKAKSYAESTVYVTIFDSSCSNKLAYFGIYPNKNLGYGTAEEKISLSKGVYFIKIQSFDESIRYGFYEFQLKDTAVKVKAPAKVAIKTPATNSKHQIIAKWNKVSGASGYQVQFAKNKSCSSVVANKTTSGASYTGKNFTKGKKYYVRVRAYKTVNGTKVYGAWSGVKAIKCK